MAQLVVLHVPQLGEVPAQAAVGMHPYLPGQRGGLAFIHAQAGGVGDVTF